MRQEIKYQIIETICIFILTLFFNLMCNELFHDEIWNYGFAYNISNGLIPYRDFNMIITPLFPIVGAFFMCIFGRTIVVYHIFNAIICTAIFNYIKKYNEKSYYIPYGIFLFFALPGYNVACVLLLYILISLEDKNGNDYIIGIILGLTFLTKQNIGILLCIPTLLTKDKRSIIKRIIGFILPNIILLMYLYHYHILYNFIDYAFLGVNSFAEKNAIVSIPALLICIIFITYLIYQYILSKNKNILYLICFFGMAYPIFDPIHVIIPLIPTLNYFLNNAHLNKKMISISFAIFIIAVFSYNIININNNFAYPNSTIAFKYRKMNGNVETSINEVTEYLKNSEEKVYIIDVYAYLIKLNANEKIDKYDLLNNGNLGKNGEKVIIKELDNYCKKNKCKFLIYKAAINNRQYSQYNQEIYSYIIDNYDEKDKVLNLTIYSNY